MGRPRAFDHDEAARLYAECRNYSEVARQLGVAMQSVRVALNPMLQLKSSLIQKTQMPWRVPCAAGCGGWATRMGTAGSRTGMCWECSALARSKSVREDTLRCTCCRLWLPDEDYPRRSDALSRRGRATCCRACGTVMKRDWRAANRDHCRAYGSERKQRLRGDATSTT